MPHNLNLFFQAVVTDESHSVTGDQKAGGGEFSFENTNLGGRKRKTKQNPDSTGAERVSVTEVRERQ